MRNRWINSWWWPWPWSSQRSRCCCGCKSPCVWKWAARQRLELWLLFCLETSQEPNRLIKVWHPGQSYVAAWTSWGPAWGPAPRLGAAPPGSLSNCASLLFRKECFISVPFGEYLIFICLAVHINRSPKAKLLHHTEASLFSFSLNFFVLSFFSSFLTNWYVSINIFFICFLYVTSFSVPFCHSLLSNWVWASELEMKNWCNGERMSTQKTKEKFTESEMIKTTKPWKMNQSKDIFLYLLQEESVNGVL